MPARGHDFADSALIGHVLSFALLNKLVIKGLITEADAAELADEALLQLEDFQSLFPRNQRAFERARDFLSQAVLVFRANGETSPGPGL